MGVEALFRAQDLGLRGGRKTREKDREREREREREKGTLEFPKTIMALLTYDMAMQENTTWSERVGLASGLGFRA